MTVLTKEQGRELLAKKPKKRKYRNEPIVVDGIRFDSRREAAYYAELKRREKAGEVGGVELQVPFPILGPAGELICTYVADFVFFDHVADRLRVIDVKGVETRDFRLKKKLMKVMKRIDVEVVR
jgi:hypothetical protein